MRRTTGLLAFFPLIAIAGENNLGPTAAPSAKAASLVPSAVNQYCNNCHDSDTKKGDLDLEKLVRASMMTHSDEWEKVVRKLRARQMPPFGKKRPDEPTYVAMIADLSSALDQAAASHPNPGRTDTFRRLTRLEYQNAIRDLLDLDVDASILLPKDDASHGFDNVTVGDLSPALLNRYISAAEKISRLAVGSPERAPGGDTVRIRPDLTQEEHVEGLPLGTRGGTLLPYTFPRDGEYEIQVRLTRDRNEEVEGLHESHQLDIILDRDLVKRYTVSPPKGDHNFEKVDAHLKMKVRVTGGRHELGVAFVKNPSSLIETKRQPYQAHYNMHRHPRQTPAVYQISINGPFESTGPGDTPSRRRIFSSYPRDKDDEEPCAARIISDLAHRAFRHPVSDAELRKPMEFYRTAREEGGFESGIGAALSAILVSPEFLFRIEQDPKGIAANKAYPIDDVELASRLSFFLWSSIPDLELLSVAEKGHLHERAMLESQTRRMLADPKSRSLVNNFAAQWLHLPNLESFTPDLRLFPDFDDNLRKAFRRETELHVETVLRDDKSALDLLKCNYTFLNERLAKHYGIPHVYGTRFRKVMLGPDSERGGLLREGSILTVTSYATRTSPVIRGNWILGNLLGTPAPPPPASVPALKENTISDSLPMRQRLAAHRANTACASCHDLMDPVGFSLENFDAIGRWRTSEDGEAIDVSGGLPDGSQFTGVAGLETGLIQHPDLFISTLTEKLLIFALGRGIEPYDAPAVRQIVRQAEREDYHLSSLILGIVNSTPFTMRKTL